MLKGAQATRKNISGYRSPTDPSQNPPSQFFLIRVFFISQGFFFMKPIVENPE